MSEKKMTGAEILEEDMREMEAEAKALLEKAAPKTPLEAAIDRAPGFKPEDAVKAVVETEKPETETEERDWVEEAYKCFIKDAQGIDPTDPVKAVEAYFQKNATEELKARCKAEGKDAKGCWRFIEAVARKALHGSSGHIDPAVVYAIAMHWYQDVPKDWNMPKVLGTAAAPKKTASVQQQDSGPKKKQKKPAETPSEKRKEKERMAKAKAKAKAKKPRAQQGFFFEMLEMQPGEQKPCGSPSPQASAGASGEENAMVPRTLPASTSSTESEVQV